MSDLLTTRAAHEPIEENQLILERREKLKAIRQAQVDGKGIAFPNDFKPQHRAVKLNASYDGEAKDELDPQKIVASVAGRMMLKRVMGKASFATLQDSTGQIQIYVTNDGVGDALHSSFKHWDLGDIVSCVGTLFKTKTGELSIHATEVRLLTKSLRPLPDKFHGMADQETKYRQRYVDLITDESARNRFKARSAGGIWSLGRPCREICRAGGEGFSSVNELRWRESTIPPFLF